MVKVTEDDRVISCTDYGKVGVGVCAGCESVNNCGVTSLVPTVVDPGEPPTSAKKCENKSCGAYNETSPVNCSTYWDVSGCDTYNAYSHEFRPPSSVPDTSEQGHYTACAIEPIDFIKANNMDFLEGNIVKYIARYKRKDGLKDLSKARQYLDWLIEREEVGSK